MLRQGARQQGRIDSLQAHVIDVLVSLVHDLLHISPVFKSCQENSCCLQSPWQTPLDRTAAIVEERPTVWQCWSYAECMRECLEAASDLLQELLNDVLDGDDAQWSALRHARKIGLLRGNTGRGLQ